MKRINFARIIWITCLFLVLIIILVMVMDYKIHYQYLTHNQLYFYECNSNLCVTEVKDNNNLMYSYYDCGYELCPVYKKNIADDYVLLEQQERENILYDYRQGKVISQDYEDYQFISNNYILVSKNNLQGIIDIQNKVVVKVSYQQLGIPKEGYLTGYQIPFIIAKKDNKYGIISLKDEKIIEEFRYTEEELDQLTQTLKDSIAKIS